MPSLRLTPSGPDVASFDLPQDVETQLYAVGGDTLTQASNEPSITVGMLNASGTRPFTVKGTASGKSTTLVLTDTKAKTTASLALNVKGAVKSQPSYTVDLIKQMVDTKRADKLELYRRIVNDPTPVLGQNTTAGKYNCGDVAAGYGVKLFSQATSTAYNAYWNPLKSDKMADITFPPSTIEKVVNKIKAMLDKGQPVRVWLIHDDGFSTKWIQGDARTHFLTIVGYSSALSRFLHIDPWPNGSVLDYDGGVYPTKKNVHLGEMSWDSKDFGKGINSVAPVRGVHTYRVIAGPSP